MVVETLLGVTLATFAQEIFKDFIKDLIKDPPKEALFNKLRQKLSKSPEQFLLDALVNALRALLQPFEDELLDNEMTEEQLKELAPRIKQFLDGREVKTAIWLAFTESDSPVDDNLLVEGWRRMPNAPALPEDFSWSYVAKSFTRAIRRLREQDPELREILVAQADAETSLATRQIAGLPPEYDLEGYRESLLEYHGNLKLELLDATGSNYRVKLWSVFVPQTARDCQEYFPQLFEIPKEHQVRLRKRGELEESVFDLAEESVRERRQVYLDQSPRPVLEVASNDRIDHLVFLGDPGSGKSTLLKAIALDWARIEDATERYARPLPLLIELAAYDRWECQNGKSFVRYLQDAQTVHRLDQFRLDRVLQRRGGAILLLDGLDEIFDPNRRKDALKDIHRFSNEYPATRIIVTSRVIGYDQRQLADAGFRHFMLQDLDESQIAEFLDRWYGTFVTDSRDRAAKKERLSRAIVESRPIRELAENPLLLTMMSILNLNQELPRDRVKLYERASEVLLHHWDFERLGLKGAVEYREKAEILRRLADHMQNASAGLKGNIIAGDDLKRIFRDYLKNELDLPNAYQATNDLVAQLRERNFILCHLGADNYAFVHRTLLEYFCASALVRRALKEKSSLEFLKTEVFGPHWNDETWHEALRLIAGMDDQVPVEHVSVIISHLLDQRSEDFTFHNVFLAADCCREVRNPRALGDSLKRVVGELQKLLQFDFPYFYELYEPEYEKRIFIRAKAVGYLANILFLDNAKTWLKDRATHDWDWPVRQAAVQELARGWKDDPDTLPLLKDRASQDDNWSMRQAAVQELARGWKDDPDTLPLLKDRATKDDNQWVRKAAAQELARGWKDDPAVMKLVEAANKESDDAPLE
ncbi:MAG TPA: HEAT repeat domain-containing protein [Blastocatellia bacterium]|nr:HEAT repeat domain-containing protein [Blastocatellia bacterium]